VVRVLPRKPRRILAMGRMPKREDRLPAQPRGPVPDVTALELQLSKLQQKLDEAEKRTLDSLNSRNTAERKAKELAEKVKQLQPPTLDGLAPTIPKIADMSSQTFYDHVDFGVSWLKRFHPDDIAPVLSAAVGKLHRQTGIDFQWKVLCQKGMGAARQLLLRKHEEQIVGKKNSSIMKEAREERSDERGRRRDADGHRWHKWSGSPTRSRKGKRIWYEHHHQFIRIISSRGFG
jgi:hypothetical protein